MLRRVELPGAAKFLVTTGKFDAEGVAKGFNVEADYPPEPAYLQTLLRWSETGGFADPRFRDGYDLYCLRRILARSPQFDLAVLLRRDPDGLDEAWPDLCKNVDGQLFLTFGDGGSPSLLVDLRDARAPALLDAAWQLYVTGAVYGLDGYSLDRALDIALEAIEPETSHRNPVPRVDETKGRTEWAEASLAGSGSA